MEKPIKFLSSLYESYWWKYGFDQLNELGKNGEMGNIVFIHGRQSGFYSMYKMASFFAKKSFGVHFVEYSHSELLSTTLPKSLSQVSNVVDIRALVGHSKGGIVALELAKQLSKKVDYVFTLSTPYDGTVYTKFPYSEKLLDLRDFQIKYHQNLNYLGCTLVNIFGKWDEMIIPNSNLVNHKADINKTFDIYGHNATIFDQKVFEYIYSFLV